MADEDLPLDREVDLRTADAAALISLQLQVSPWVLGDGNIEIRQGWSDHADVAKKGLLPVKTLGNSERSCLDLSHVVSVYHGCPVITNAN